MLDVTRMRVLVALAETGSVTGAAQQLHYSQPSISHHLGRLEAETGLALTTRVGRGVRLTPAGELLARRSAEILGRLTAAEDELAALAGLRTGRVRVSGFESALSVLAAPAVARLRATHPGLEVSLTDLHPDLALPMLRAGELDAAIVFRYDDGDYEGDIRGTHLLDDPMCLLSTRPGETLGDHRDSPWIAGCELCRRDFEQACAKHGFTPNIAFSSDDLIVAQALVASGVGVHTAPSLALLAHHADGVHATPIRGFRRRVHVVTFGVPPDPPATAAFLAALRDAVGELRLSGTEPRSAQRPPRRADR